MAQTAMAMPAALTVLIFSLKATAPTSVPQTMTPMFIPANTSVGLSDMA